MRPLSLLPSRAQRLRPWMTRSSGGRGACRTTAAPPAHRGGDMARRAQDVYTEWRGGTCRVKWWSGEYHDDGRKRFESKGGFDDEDEAFQYGQDKLYENRHGTHVKNRDGATLLTDWLDSWLDGLDHAHPTEENYRSIVETHIRPYFKKRNAAVADIDVLAYRAFRKHINGVLKPSTAKKVMTILGMILDDAVPRLIKVSPVE